MDKPQSKIIIPGGAGLVGQNLVAILKLSGHSDIVVLDKHEANLAVLRCFHPDIIAEHADLAEPGDWERHFSGADAVVMLQAQIGDLRPEPFLRNNITSTKMVLNAMKRFDVPYLVHVSSSVVESVANDLYTGTKKEQERLVLESGIPNIVLRPTLMFGWFDRKHFGWLSRFMRRVPVFPIPGDGRFMRQPLYAGDFCRIIVRCIQDKIAGQILNISGMEKVDYIDIIREIRRATRARTMLIHIPVSFFSFLLKTWALFDRNPPFTADQLKALVAHDEFEIIDWPGLFDARPTPLAVAIEETFTDPLYSKVVLKF